MSIPTIHATAQPEPAGDVSDDELEELAEDLEWKRLSWQEGSGPSFALELARAAIALDRSRQPAPPAEALAEALAARPLLEQVAAMGDLIGAATVGQIMAISGRAAAWLAANPPGQPVAIEPRGCPTPGACSCVQPPTSEQGRLMPRPTHRELWELFDAYSIFYGEEKVMLSGSFIAAVEKLLAGRVEL